jgi:hypothetical protein
VFFRVHPRLHKVPGSNITFFVVHKLHSGGDPVYGRGGEKPNGVMNRPLGISFIGDSRLPSTFAHEAGHFVGDMSHEGTDTKLLMRGEGSGYRSRSRWPRSSESRSPSARIA